MERKMLFIVIIFASTIITSSYSQQNPYFNGNQNRDVKIDLNPIEKIKCTQLVRRFIRSWNLKKLRYIEDYLAYPQWDSLLINQLTCRDIQQVFNRGAKFIVNDKAADIYYTSARLNISAKPHNLIMQLDKKDQIRIEEFIIGFDVSVKRYKIQCIVPYTDDLRNFTVFQRKGTSGRDELLEARIEQKLLHFAEIWAKSWEDLAGKPQLVKNHFEIFYEFNEETEVVRTKAVPDYEAKLYRTVRRTIYKGKKGLDRLIINTEELVKHQSLINVKFAGDQIDRVITIFNDHAVISAKQIYYGFSKDSTIVYRDIGEKVLFIKLDENGNPTKIFHEEWKERDHGNF